MSNTLQRFSVQKLHFSTVLFFHCSFTVLFTLIQWIQGITVVELDCGSNLLFLQLNDCNFLNLTLAWSVSQYQIFKTVFVQFGTSFCYYYIEADLTHISYFDCRLHMPLKKNKPSFFSSHIPHSDSTTQHLALTSILSLN